MAYFDGDFDQFLDDRLKSCKGTCFPKASTRPQPKQDKQRSFRFNRKLVWLVVSYLVVVGLLFGSVGTAFAAMDSLPNEPLYAVKLAGEDLQFLLTSDTSARISLLTTFANRRAVEAFILSSQGQPVPEQVRELIDQYQQEIVMLATSLEDEIEPEGVYIQRQPRDRDGDEVGDTTREEYRKNHPDPALVPEDQTNATFDLEIPDTTISITGTFGITGTMNMTQTRSGPSNGSGQENRQEYSPGPEYGPGPEFGPSDVVPSPRYGPGPCYGPGNSCTVPEQSPETNPQMGSGSTNQPTENKGNKP